MSALRRRPGAGVLAVAAALALAAAPSIPAVGRPRHESERPTAFPTASAVVDRAVSDGRILGAVGAYAGLGRRTTFAAAGRARLGVAAAPTPDTLWRVYSMTKPITGVAAMILVQEGRLRLDEPLADVIPAYRDMRVLVGPADLRSRPAARPITIRELLTHTSGLTYAFAPTRPIDREYLRLGLVPYAFDPAGEDSARRNRPPNLQAFAERLAGVPLVAEPGTEWNYSVGLDVLAAVIERVSGMPFDRFVRTRILDPLGMRSTAFAVRPADADRLADSVGRTDGRWRVVEPGAGSIFTRPPTFPYGGAGLVSSARDYDRFLAMLQGRGSLDGVRILDEATARLAMSDLLPPGVRYDFNASGTPTSHPTTLRAGFGAGGVVFTRDVPGWPGRGTFGWSGAAGTIALVNARLGYRAALMTNERPPDPDLQPEFFRAVSVDVGRADAGGDRPLTPSAVRPARGSTSAADGGGRRGTGPTVQSWSNWLSVKGSARAP